VRERERDGGGDDNHVVFGQKFLGEKGSVRPFIVVMQQPVIAVPNPVFTEQRPRSHY
jgi:hypothetical protein